MRELMPSPHHIAATMVLCCCVWSWPDRPVFISLLSHHVLAFGYQTVFISVRPLFHDALWTHPPPLPACPVLFCSAPSLFPFHWHCPSFPPLSLSLCLSLSVLLHSSDLFLPPWSRSDWDRGEERGREGARNVKFSFVLILLDYLLFPCLHSLLFLWSKVVAAHSKRWQSMGSNSEVGNLTGVWHMA